jgi:monoamine oxidase
MATEIPVDKPWKAPNAAAWDSQTFQTWIDDNTSTDGGKFLLSVATKAIFSAEPRDLSLLYAVYYMAAAGNEDTPGTIERLVSTTGGAQMHRFVGGSQRVPERLAKKLGDAVHLGVPVSRIVQERGRVRVVGKGLTAVGKRVVVAIPPPLAARIEYHPGLPAARDQLTQRFTMGSVMKVIATYDKPFWRDDGLAGQVVSDTGPVQVTFDNTPHGGSPGTLMGFIEADDARSLDAASHQSIEKQVLANFVTYFGEPAADAERFLIQRWDEQIWSRGGPVSFAPPGLLLSFGRAIRKPVGRIHWAGTETSDYWTGYMDGAVRSGERVAKEIVKALA